MPMARRRKKHSRQVVVYSSLIGVVTFTSVLLLALAPDPLAPLAGASLSAVHNPAELELVLQTDPRPQAGRWKYIYIRHSQTASGNAATLGGAEGMGDHFLIGNGQGCQDGEIQLSQRWLKQAGSTIVDNPGCISILLVGDFNRTSPTNRQQQRLVELLALLQQRLEIPGGSVLMSDEPGNPAGIGGLFDQGWLRANLLR